MHDINIGDQVGSLDPEDSRSDRGVVEAISPDGTRVRVRWNNGNTHWAQASMLSTWDISAALVELAEWRSGQRRIADNGCEIVCVPPSVKRQRQG